MTKDKERDDALIAEKERLADILEKKAGNAYYAITSVDLRQAAAILRGDEQPKPDRAEVLVHELWIMDSGPSQSVWLEVVRRHFTELRAEWEAERQDEPVCLIGKVDCDGNELVTVSKDALDRYKDQARYTYQRAEKAEARVKELEAERPAVVVPEDVRRVVWETARDALSKNWLPVYDFIKSLDGAKGPAVVVPEDDWSKGKEDCDGNELITFRKDDLVKHMTNRFLGWRLPEDFRPDDGISFEPEFNKEWNASQGKPPQRRTPTGTNLFNATQAEAMVRYMIDGAKGGE